jgi:hypothetical protein
MPADRRPAPLQPVPRILCRLPRPATQPSSVATQGTSRPQTTRRYSAGTTGRGEGRDREPHGDGVLLHPLLLGLPAPPVDPPPRTRTLVRPHRHRNSSREPAPHASREPPRRRSSTHRPSRKRVPAASYGRWAPSGSCSLPQCSAGASGCGPVSDNRPGRTRVDRPVGPPDRATFTVPRPPRIPARGAQRLHENINHESLLTTLDWYSWRGAPHPKAHHFRCFRPILVSASRTTRHPGI